MTNRLKLIWKFLCRFQFLVAIVLFPEYSNAQSEYMKQAPSLPVPPSAYEFIKYGEVPVTEYTGLPSIKIPLYTMKNGDIEFPLELSYHAGGIRVSEEASNVGLGWSMSIGTVTQIVNDKDDFDDDMQRRRLNYYALGVPYRYLMFPYTYYSNNQTLSPELSNSTITKEAPVHTWITYIDYLVPVGDELQRDAAFFNAEMGATRDFVDNEPDVFKASFAGHYLEFVTDFSSGTNVFFKVLNKKNYTVYGGGTTWTIICPDGMTYRFGAVEEIKNELSHTTQLPNGSQNSYQDVNSRTWHLTKIESPNNRTITFIYGRTPAVRDLPSLSHKELYSDQGDEMGAPCDEKFTDVFLGELGQAQTGDVLLSGESYSRSLPFERSYLTSIDFQIGMVEVVNGEREDRPNDKRIDAIKVKSGLTTIKQFKFDYSYFVATESGPSLLRNSSIGSMPFDDLSLFASSQQTHRLKLLSITEDQIPPIQFFYDETELPKKTSFATDYWGFYNGKTTNTSFLPNPTHLGLSTNLGNTSNDRRPSLDHSRAGTLTGIKYPTGGRTEFDYELHQIDEHDIPTSDGMGLRVKSIKDFIGDEVKSHTSFSYQGGKAMTPLFLFGEYFFTGYLKTPCPSLDCAYTTPGLDIPYNVSFLAGSNYLASSMLGSGTFVGYDKVTKKILTNDAAENGEVSTWFYNSTDIVAADLKADLVLPARKNPSVPENGLIKKVEMRDWPQGTLIKETFNEYEYKITDVDFGLKYASAGEYGYSIPSTTYCQTWRNVKLVGYYPLYGGESILKWTETNEYRNGRKFSTRTTNTYYPDNQLETSQSINSKAETVVTKYYYPGSSADPVLQQLAGRNILNVPYRITTTRSGKKVSDVITTYKNFPGVGLIKPNFVTKQIGSLTPQTQITFHDYDIHGNILRYEMANGIQNSIVWGYDGSLPLAHVLGSTPSDIAYSGFEDPAVTGGWTYTNTFTSNAKTGTKGFIGGSVSKDHLSPGVYDVSFWARATDGGTGNLSGTGTLTITGSIWKLYTFKISITSVAEAVNLNFSNCIVDELRLHPEGSMMKTFTHNPLIGLEAQCDENNIPTFYEFDSSLRLKEIRDFNQDIIKAFKYGFKGE
jgi:hypothetical protein